MALTRSQIRAKLFKRGFGLGFARTATAIASGAKTVTDAVAFQNAAAGEGDYRGMYIYRPLAAAANQIREASVVSGTSLTHEGLAYSGDASVLDYEIIGLLHPDELNECIRLALRMVYFETYAPMTPWTDGAFGGTISSPYDWAANATGTTPTYTSTQANNFRGYNSLLLTNAGYVYTSALDVSPGDILIHGAAAKASGGEYITTYTLVDADDLTALETVSFTSRNLLHFIRKTEIPAGTYRVKAKLQTATNSIFDYTFGHLYGLEGIQNEVPSWMTEQWRLLGFGPAEYGRAVADRLYNARSQHIGAWKRPGDFELYPLTEEANPYHLQVNIRDSFGNLQGLPDADMWYHGLRPFSDIVDLDDETDSTDAPEDLVIAACVYTVATMLLHKTEDAKWSRMQQEAAGVLMAQREARGRIPEQYKRSVSIPGGRGGPGGPR